MTDSGPEHTADRLSKDQQEPLHILIVEDSPDHTELVVRAFRQSPIASVVSSCQSLADARRALETNSPDLIIADMRLPDGIGTELLMGPDGPQPLVLMTSYGDESQAVKAIKSGCLDYVVKSDLAFFELPDIARRAVRDWRILAENRAAQEALARSEGRYRRLFESVPAGVFQCDSEGLIMTANPAMSSMLGYAAPDQLVGVDMIRDVIRGGPDAPVSISEFDRTGLVAEMEVEMNRAGGGVATVLMTTRAMKEDGKVFCFEGFCFDISRRRQADEALVESRLRFEAIFRDSFGFMLIMDTAGQVTDINESVLRAVGLKRADVVGRCLWDMPWWKELESERKAARVGAERSLGGEQYRDQMKFYSSDGTLQTADRSFTPVKDEQGRLKFVVVEGRDITELVETSQRLEQSESQFRTLFENAPEAIVVIDMESRGFTDANGNAEALFETSREKLIGLGPAELSPPVQPGRGLSAELAKQYLQAAVAGQKPVFEWIHRTTTGKDVPCEIRLTRLPHDSRLLIRGSIIDITARKKAETSLRQSEQRVSALVENATAGILEIDGEGRIMSANPAAVGMLGQNRYAEMQGKPYLNFVMDNDKKRVRDCLDAARSGHDGGLVYGVLAGSREHALSSSFVAIRSADGSVSRVMLLSDDITKRNQNEARLRAEKKFTEIVINSLPGIFYVINEQGMLVRWNRNFQQLSGLDEEAFAKTHPLSFFVAEDRVAMKAELAKVLRSGEGRIEARLLSSAGKQVPYMLTGLRLRTEDQAYMVGMGFDISQRKLFEAKLRASENYLRSVVESEPECVWTLDRNGRLLNINPAGRVMLGEETVAYAEKESVVSLVSPDHRRAFSQLNNSVFEGHSGILTFEIATRRGGNRWLETHAVALKNERGKIEAHLAVTRDVTAKREADRKIGEYSSRLQTLSQRLLETQESERRHVARELHDEVGQSLTALKLDLEASASGGKISGARLLDSLQIVERILNQVRGMSLDLRPAILDDLGLLPALRWYIDRQSARSRIAISLRGDTLAGVRLPSEIETASFRIVQEALTNVIRHSGASSVRVLLEIDSERLWIHVRDDGHGFDSDSAIRSSTQGESFGLLGLQERAILLGGQVEIQSSDQNGTEVIAWLPLQGWAANSKVQAEDNEADMLAADYDDNRSA